MWGSDPVLLGENFCNYNYRLICELPNWTVDLDCTVSTLLLPVLFLAGSGS